MRELFQFASNAGYEAIELWEPHVNSEQINKIVNLSREYDLDISMISIDTNLTSDNSSFLETLEKINEYVRICRKLNCGIIRIFTGSLSSKKASEQVWRICLDRLGLLSEIAVKNNIKFALETHPNTLLDTTYGIRRILKQISHPTIGLNFDVYHVWQESECILEMVEECLPRIFHFHLKNATSKDHSIFDKTNVYNPYIKEKRIVNLDYPNRGAINYYQICTEIIKRFNSAVSVEWFGDSPFEACLRDAKFLRSIKSNFKQKSSLMHKDKI